MLAKTEPLDGGDNACYNRGIRAGYTILEEVMVSQLINRVMCECLEVDLSSLSPGYDVEVHLTALSTSFDV